MRGETDLKMIFNFIQVADQNKFSAHDYSLINLYD